MAPIYQAEVATLVNSISSNELAVFCGAGISIDSGIPGAITLLEKILKKLGINENDFNLFIEKSNNRASLKIPFELFIEQVLEGSNEESLFKLFEIFESKHLNPNANHLFISKLAKLGRLKTIITTNFDTLIEQALKNENVDHDVFYNEKFFDKINWNSNKVRVIKLHGSADDKKSIVATIRALSRIYSKKQRNVVIEKIFSNGPHHHVLILGYSCSDIFDITPSILSLEGNLKRVSIVEHDSSNSLIIEPIESKNDRGEFKNPFKFFFGSMRIYCDTSCLTSTLWDALFSNDLYKNKFILPSDTIINKIDIWGKILKSPNTINAKLFFWLGRYEKSLYESRKALAIRLKKFGKNNQYTANSYNNVGIVYGNVGNYGKSIRYHQAALSIRKQILSKNHPDIASSYNNLGVIYYKKGQYDKAIDSFESSFNIKIECYGLENPSTAHTLNNLGAVYYLKGEYDTAIEYYKKSMQVNTKMLGDDHPSTATNHEGLGLSYSAKGEMEHAVKHYKKTFSIFAKVFGENHPKTTGIAKKIQNYQ